MLQPPESSSDHIQAPCVEQSFEEKEVRVVPPRVPLVEPGASEGQAREAGIPRDRNSRSHLILG